MPVSDTITAFYSFSANTTIKSAEHNNNFNAFRGHLIAVDGSLSALAVTKSYDLGSSNRYWRAGYIGQINSDTLSTSTLVATTGTVTTLVATTATVTSLVATTATITDLRGITVSNWTPRVDGSSVTGTASYSVQVGRQTRIGNRVFLDAYISWSGGTGTGNLRIAGLPITPENVSNYRASAAIGYWDNIALTAGAVPVMVAGAAQDYLSCLQIPSGGGTVVNVAYDAAGLLMFSISYNV